jgi:hypothetical protein
MTCIDEYSIGVFAAVDNREKKNSFIAESLGSIIGLY